MTSTFAAKDQSGIYTRVGSSLLGNICEHYDKALFALLTPYFAPLFFPHHDRISGLILTYAMVSVSMFARPLGSLVFGYIGDTRGKQQALFVSLMGMALVTMLMGLCPTFEHIGYLAPIILCTGRFLQNFFSSGETVGGALYLLENSKGKKDLLSSIFDSSSIAGGLLGSAAVGALASWGLVEHYWRGLFLLGGVTALCGVVLRNAEARNSPFQSERTEDIRASLKGLWEDRRQLVPIVIVSGFSYACYTVALILVNGFIPLISDIAQADVITMNTSLVLIDFLLLPLFGYGAVLVGREKMMLSAALFTVCTGIPLFMSLEGATLAGAMMVRTLLVAIGVWFSATYHSWAQEQVPEKRRYTQLSLGYSLGAQLIGGPTPAITLWLFQMTGQVWIASLWWVFLAVITAFTLVLCAEKQGKYADSHLSLQHH